MKDLTNAKTGMLKITLYCGLLLLFATASTAQNAKAPPQEDSFIRLETSRFPIRFDVHTHASGLETEEGVQNYIRLLEDQLFEKAALISPSYLARPGRFRSDGSLVSEEEILSIKRRQDQQASALVQAYPDRLVGLCGISLDWRAAVNTDSTLECLDLPGMVGLKVRFASGEYLSQSPYREDLRTLLLAADGKIRFVLLHLATYEHARRNPQNSDYSNWVAQDESEIDVAVEFMAEFPDIQFVLAHNLFGPRMVHYFAERVRAEGTSNHWLDTSHVLPATLHADPQVSEEEFHRRYALAWRDFGVERVLFGSDVIAGVQGQDNVHPIYTDSSAYQEEEYAILSNPHLSEIEKERILSLNGTDFWNAIGRDSN